MIEVHISSTKKTFTYFARAGLSPCGNDCFKIFRIALQGSVRTGSRIGRSFLPKPCDTRCDAGTSRDLALRKSTLST